jgi:hypothetical protein
MADNDQTTAGEAGKSRLSQIGTSDGDGYHSATPSMYSLAESAQLPHVSHPSLINSPSQTLPADQPFVFTSGPTGTEQQAEVHEGDDLDSAYDSESLLGDDTVTLASYITDYRYEHGRRYHAYRDGAYWVSWIPYLR